MLLGVEQIWIFHHALEMSPSEAKQIETLIKFAQIKGHATHITISRLNTTHCNGPDE
jgi:hypothetical protein